MRLTHRHGDDAVEGGVDLVFSLTSAEATTLGMEASQLADLFQTMLVALVNLRGGDDPTYEARHSPHHLWAYVVEHTETRIAPRVEGIRDAAIRAHAASGGSYGDLADAMGVSRSTAQHRRDAVTSREPGHWERWARGELPNRPTTPPNGRTPR